MKLIFTLILFTLCFTVKAQNWKTVATGDTTYFRGSIDTTYLFLHDEYYTNINTQADSGRFRVTWVDSFTVSGLDTTYHFFKSVRKTADPCLDTLGASWLGQRFIYGSDGLDYYFNSENDTIHIERNAQAGDEWIIAYDTTGIAYKGTVSQVGLMTIEGGQDSFKTIMIQAMLNGNAVTSEYNGKVLEWTKNHGWLRTLDMYRFPNAGVDFVSFTGNVGPHLDTGQLYRMDNNFAHLDMNYIDLQWKYAPGNEWIHYNFPGGGNNMTDLPNVIIKHDSVISSTLLDTNTIVVDFLTNYYQKLFYMNDDSILAYTYYHTDTITKDTAQAIVSHTWHPEVKPAALDGSESEVAQRYFVDTLCGGRPVIKSYGIGGFVIPDSCTSYNYYILSGYSAGSMGKLFGFGDFLSHFEAGEYGGGDPDLYNKKYYSYLKLPDCTYGTKIDVIELGLENTAKQLPVISIHPNPAKDYVTVQSPVTDENAVITLMDMTGRTLLEQHGLKQANQINVSGFSAGIYLVNITTTHGSNTYKLVISN